MKRWLRRILAAVLLTPLVAVLAFRAAVAWWPDPPDRTGRPQAGATILLDRDGHELAVIAGVDGQFHLPLAAEDAGPWLAHAVIAVEDSRFHEHGGVDWKAVSAAVWEDVSSLSIRRGASTIAMQVVRLRDPRPRSLPAKFMQAVRATQLMQRGDRDAVTLEYLNRAPFGGNLVGAASASWRYFGKPCSRLTLAETATLAGLPQSPNRLRPDRFPQAATARRDHVLDRMRACGMITADQHDQAIAEPLIAQWRQLPQQLAGAPAATAMPTLAHLTTGRPGGMLQTTIDPNLQKAVADLAKLHLADLPTSSGDLAAAVIVLDTATGDCLAAVNTGPAAGELDLTHRRRSTGSTLKPFIYALAFEEGVCGPETLLNDGQISFAGYTPRNFDRVFRGQMPAREALAQSRNIPAMDLLSRVGVGRTSRLLGDLGLRQANDPDRYGLTLAVGGAEASPIEIAGAFATLGRGGRYVPPRLTTDALAAPQRLLSAKACGQVMQALADSTRTGRLSPAAAKLGVAWKTGTSSDQRDAWCAALTPARTVVVWMGKPASNGDAALVGIEAAAPLALAVAVAADGTGTPTREGQLAMPSAEDELPPARSHRFAIVAPQSRQEIVIDPAMPAENQQVVLQVDQPTADDVYWFVDAEPLLTGSQGRQWWSPTPGAHTIRAVTASGEASSVRVVVKLLDDAAQR